MSVRVCVQCVQCVLMQAYIKCICYIKPVLINQNVGDMLAKC